MKNNFEWKEYKIGELCTLKPNPYKGDDEYVVYLRTEDVLNGKITKHILEKRDASNKQFKTTFDNEDILYSPVRPINRHFAYINIKTKYKYSYLLTAAFLTIKSVTSILRSKYLFNILRSNEIIEILQDIAFTKATTYPRFSFSDLALLKVSIPPFEIQDKIIKITDSLDNKIETNDKIIENLKSQILTLYQHYFVNVDIEQKIKTQGWKKQSLLHNDLCSVIKSGIDKFEGEKEYFATADVQQLDIKKGTYVSLSKRPGRANMQPVLHSVWFAKMKDSPKHILLNNALKFFVENSLFSTGFAGLKCSKKSFEYIASFILFPLFEQIKNNLSNGTTQQVVNQDDFNKIPLIVPPQNIIEDYHNLTKAMFENLNTLLLENKKLEKLREKLITKLLNNELDLSKIKV